MYTDVLFRVLPNMSCCFGPPTDAVTLFLFDELFARSMSQAAGRSGVPRSTVFVMLLSKAHHGVAPLDDALR